MRGGMATAAEIDGGGSGEDERVLKVYMELLL